MEEKKYYEFKRCSWVKLDSDLSVEYHDKEWSLPCFDDEKLFEYLILESQQSGLSWHTILKKRENYRTAFDSFDIRKISSYDEYKVKELLSNSGIIKNKLKIKSVINNAKVFLEIQNEFSSFSSYIWSFTDNKIIHNEYLSYDNAPVESELSNMLSKDLKKRGMKFIGSKTMQAYLQAIGIINAHQSDCFCRNRLRNR